MLEVTKTFKSDLMEITRSLHASGILVDEAPGLWLSYRDAPSIVEGRMYYQDDGETMVPGDIEDIRKMATSKVRHNNICDHMNNIVVPGNNISDLRDHSHPYSSVARALVKDYVGLIIAKHEYWSDYRPQKIAYRKSIDLRDAIRPYIKSSILGTQNEEQAFLEIEDYLLYLWSDIKDFLGQNHWVMHFHKLDFNTLVIEATQDYRIMEWMRQNADTLGG